MRKFCILFNLLFISIIFSSCNPKVITDLTKTYPPVDFREDIIVIGLEQDEGENWEELGIVKVGDSGFSTNCGYDLVIEKAKLEAMAAGGNAIKVIEHKLPSALGSSCHRIVAKILRIENIEDFKSVEVEEELLDVDYAVINIYRYGGAGVAVSYDLYMGDSLICRVKNNFKTTVHVKTTGHTVLWAHTEAKVEVPVHIQLGKEYYLRCGLTMGVFVGHPSLELVDKKTGKSEFESFNAKNR